MIQIFITFLKLGLTSFGGPIAHLAFFHNEFVTRKKWINEQEYADLVALCQVLPGPASSQVGMAVGYFRGGVFGSILAWIAFTLPSAVLLVLFALSMASLTDVLGHGWLHGLKIAAVVVVAQAVWEMGKKFCKGFGKVILALASTGLCFYFQSAWVQISLIIIGAVSGVLFFEPVNSDLPSLHSKKNHHFLSSAFLTLFFTLLIILPLLAYKFDFIELKLANVFYRLGALVFGGGHVVLPLIQTSVVDAGWITKESFVAGYGAAQAIPGPLFSISAYLGFQADRWVGAGISLFMMFLPSFFLVIGVLPYWQKIRSYKKMQAALIGVNAVVVGLLLAAFCNPVWTSAIFSWKDVLLAFVAFALLTFKKLPSYVIVIVLGAVTALPFY